MPCGNCPADIWPGPRDQSGAGQLGDNPPAKDRLPSRVWQDRDGAVHCRTPGAGHAPSWCGPDCGLLPSHRPIRVQLGDLTGTVVRIEPSSVDDDGWLVAPDDGAARFWTPASYAHVLGDGAGDGTSR